MPKIIFYQGGHWSGQSRGNLVFLQGQGILQIREKLNIKEVREKSGNFIILAQNICCSRYFDYLKCGKKVLVFTKYWFFLLLARSYENWLILEHSGPRN